MMNVKLTEEYFKILVSYWAGKLRLPLPAFRRDNRVDCLGYINYCKDCRYFTFTYNFSLLKTLKEELIMATIFHELGHIKFKAYKYKNKVNNEYLAEKYSLKCIKKYYPDYLDIVIKDNKDILKDNWWIKKYPIHYKAFLKIKEYK